MVVEGVGFVLLFGVLIWLFFEEKVNSFVVGSD